MLKELRAKRTKLVTDMRAMIASSEAESRDFTAEEIGAYDALKAEKDTLDKRISRLEDQDGFEAALTTTRPANASVPQLAAVPRRGAEARTQFENVGEFLHAVRFNPNDQRLQFNPHVGATDDNGEPLHSELRTDDGPSGGFMLPPQFRDTLLRLSPQDAIIRPRAQVIEPGSPPDGPVTMPALDQTGSAPGNMYGGVQVTWISEGAPKPRTDMKLREITLTPHEVAGTMLVTDKLLRNWQAANSLIEKQLRGAMAQAEDFAFLQGNGVGKPLGILKAAATYKVPRAQANKISYLDLVAMLARCYGSGIFVYSKSCLPQLMTLQNPNGQYIWAASAIPGQPSTLLGMPAIESNRNPVIGSMGDVWMADLGQYLIKDGSGPFVAASEHVYFEQNKTVIKAFWNVDGSPWLTGPITLENGYQTSPFVALDVPSV